MDGCAAVACAASCWCVGTGDACCVSFGPARLVGEHGHGGCAASTYAAGARNEWRLVAGRIRRPATDACDAATWVQKPGGCFVGWGGGERNKKQKRERGGGGWGGVGV